MVFGQSGRLFFRKLHTVPPIAEDLPDNQRESPLLYCISLI